MQHRTSTDSIRQSMCDIWFCNAWPEKSQHAASHIDRFDLPVDVRYLVLYLLARKSQHAASHIDRFDSPVDVRYLVCISWPEKSQHAASHIDPCSEHKLRTLNLPRFDDIY